MKKYYCLIFLTIFLNTLVYSQTDRFEAAVKRALNSDLFFTDDEFFGVSTKDSLTVEDACHKYCRKRLLKSGKNGYN